MADVGAAAIAAAPKRGGRLRIATTGAPTGDILDPLTTKAGQGGEYVVARWPLVFQRLTRPDRDGKIVNELAQEFSPNKDGSVWKIRVRDGVTWHDGSPLTADDIVYTLKYIINPATVSQGQHVLDSIMKPSGIKRIDKTTVQLTLFKPLAILPLSLSIYTIWMVKEGAKYPMNNAIGTGPWMLKKWVKGQSTLYARNPNYWGHVPYLDELQMVLIADDTARLNALQSGQVDGISQLDPKLVPTIKKNDKLRVQTHGGGAFTPMTMFVDQAPFTDNRVRTALKLLANRPQLIDNALGGIGVIGNDVPNNFDPDKATLADIPQRHYDPEQAKSLLKQAGQSDLKLTLVTSTAAPGMLDSGTLYAQQAKAGGVTVTIQNVPQDQFWNTYYLKSTFGMTYWGSRALDDYIAEAMVPKAPYPETHLADPKFTKLWEQYRATLNDTKRHDLSIELQKYLHDNSGYVIWGFQSYIDAYSAKVKGLVSGADRNFNFYNFTQASFA
jgi:peptide/nickel transport system substrate-binding protein